MTFKVMLRDRYDADSNDVVDRAEGVRVVTEFPTNPKKGDMVLMNGELYICTNVD